MVVTHEVVFEWRIKKKSVSQVHLGEACSQVEWEANGTALSDHTGFSFQVTA